MLLFCSPATCKPPAFEKTLAPEFVCGALGREVVVPTRLTSLAYQMVVTSSCVPLQLMPKPMNTVPSNSRVLVMSISVYSQLVLAPFSRRCFPARFLLSRRHRKRLKAALTRHKPLFLFVLHRPGPNGH